MQTPFSLATGSSGTKNILFLLIVLAFIHGSALAQDVVPLYPGTQPAASDPSLTVYLPAKDQQVHPAVLVIPGGAYGFLAIDKEGHEIAKSFIEKGIAAFVLQYRLPGTVTAGDKSIVPLQDAQQAIKLLRTNATRWNIDSSKIGVIGFSAGGHLASMLGTHFDTSFIANPDRVNLRPGFMVLVYPVTSMDSSITHPGSRINLLGEHPAEDKVRYYSSEQQVTGGTPPTYLTHTSDDKIVSVQNSIVLYQSLVKNNVPAELHLYPKGDHGFIQRLPVYEWMTPVLLFMKRQGMYNGEIPGRDASDPNVLAKELRAMEADGRKEEAGELAQQFINKISERDLFKKENLRFIIDFTAASNQRGFSLMLENRVKIDTLLDRSWSPASYGLRRIIAAEEITPFLKDTSRAPGWEKIQATVEKKYGAIGLEACYGRRMIYAMQHNDYGTAGQYFVKYFATALPRPEYQINALCWELFKHVSDKEVLNSALRAMKYDLEVFTLKGNAERGAHLDTYANLLYKTGKVKQALRWQQEAVAAAPADKEISENFEKMKKGIRTWKE